MRGWLLLLALSSAACQGAAVQGLDPLEPAQTNVDVWPDIPTLRPTFRWSPFPGDEDELIYEYDLHRLADVRYDLVVLRASTELAIVYERTGLRATEHPIELELDPGTKYLWSVRARFELEGKTRVTPWSTLGPLGTRNPRRIAQAPNPWLFRFETRTLGPQNQRR
jgi:hypothetical protein